MHPTNIPGWEGTLKELADGIENMRYDKVVEFLGHLSTSFAQRSRKDLVAGRKKLSVELTKIRYHLLEAQTFMGLAWDICKTKMPAVDFTKEKLPEENK